MFVQHETEDSGLDLERIRKSLQSRSVAERTEAESELKQLTARELIDLMALERRNRARRQKWVVGGVATYLIVMVLFSLVLRNAHMIMYIGSFSGMLAAATAFSPAHKGAARALAEIDDISVIGPLTEALEMPDPEVQSALRKSLEPLYRRLRSSDAHLLNEEQRRILRKRLNERPSAKNGQDERQLIIAVLKALEQVGDESFLPTVENLAAARSGYIGAAEVSSAAAECLPFLRQRVDNMRMSHDLLRAASADHTREAEGLLRPADSGGHTEPAQLLRPASND